MLWSVVGQHGFIGRTLIEVLARSGEAVRGVSAPRLEGPPSADPGELAELARHCPQTAALGEQLAGTDVVVNAAGIADSGARPSSRLVGANALLPAVIALATQSAGIPRMLQISSAAVQGRTPVLDESRQVMPATPYARSKALAEQTLRLLHDETDPASVPMLMVIIRATSVQGAGRGTSDRLARVARSRLASVARPGDQPTPVTSAGELADHVLQVGRHPHPPEISLQPWNGATVSSVLIDRGGHPHRLPRPLCRSVITALWAVGRLAGPGWSSRVRQLELMWFGQGQRVRPLGAGLGPQPMQDLSGASDIQRSATDG